MSRRRTLKRYENLYRDPTSLFPASDGARQLETILFPNGENEIWLRTPDGLGVRIVASNGPHGLGVRVGSFVGTPKITAPDTQDEIEVELCQYRQDARSQAFRRWYRHEETTEDVALLGAEYKRNS